jgi:hypothetical protein
MLSVGEADVTPGASSQIDLTLRNTSTIVDGYRLEVIGVEKEWATITPEVVSLFPGATGDATLTFHPDAERSPLAGPHPFAVKATALDDPSNSVVEEGTVNVGALRRLSSELGPPTSQGWCRGRHNLWVTNDGNIALPVTVEGSDADQQMRIRVRPRLFTVTPGTARQLTVRATAPHIFPSGPDRKHRFTLRVTAEGTSDNVIPATFRHRALLSRRLLRALAALAVLAVLGHLILRPLVHSNAHPLPTTAPLPTPTAGSQGRQGQPGVVRPHGLAGPVGKAGTAGAAGMVAQRVQQVQPE